MTFPPPLRVTVLTATLALLLTGSAAHGADGTGSRATIYPGVQTDTDGGGQCTSNFVFTDGRDAYLGQAAHCAGTDGLLAATDGCGAGSQPIGTEVDIEGASQPGTLVYSSWLTMQDVGETDSDACQFNDFALVRIAEADESRVSPTLSFGGPTGLDTDGLDAGGAVYSYGNSGLRQGLLPTRGGLKLETVGGGWSHVVLLPLTPGLPGDSGSAVVNEQGEALGLLVTIALAPLTGTNGVTDLHRALTYANTHADSSNSRLPEDESVVLVRGDEPFDAPEPLDGLGDGLGVTELLEETAGGLLGL